MDNTNVIDFAMRKLLSRKMIVELPEHEYKKILDNVTRRGPENGETIETNIKSGIMNLAQRSYEARKEIGLMERRAKRKKFMDEEDEKRIAWLRPFLIDRWIISKRPLIDPDAPDDFSRVSNKPIRNARDLNRQPLPINWG